MLKKILLTSVFGVVITIVGAVATPTDLDRKTASSKAYVDTMVATKQLKIPAAGQPNVDEGETVMTYTANGDGEIGERGLYSDASSYDADTDGDKLITASALNDTFTNLPTTNTTKLECANQGDGCSLWTIVDQTAYTIQLPAGYTRLGYIESTGRQYIDLGYKGNGNTKVEVKFKYYQTSSATGSGRVFGSRISAASGAFAMGASSGTVSSTNNKIFWCYDSQQFYVDNTDFGLDVWKTVVFSATEHSIDGVSVGNDYNIVEFETPQNLKLFAFDNNGTIGYGYVDIAYCKLWDNGVLVRDLVPAKNSSNVIGMYDTVSGRFFTNAATSGEDFRPGPVAQ